MALYSDSSHMDCMTTKVGEKNMGDKNENRRSRYATEEEPEEYEEQEDNTPVRRSASRPPFWTPGKKLFMTIFIIIFLIVVGVITAVSYVNVPAGYKGVITSAPNGKDIGSQLDEGWHFNPYYALCKIELIRYNSQTEEFVGQDTGDDNAGSIAVRTADNLELYVDFSITYHLPADKVGKIRVQYGDFKSTILLQVARSCPRDIASNYLALDIAGNNRSLLEHDMRLNITNRLATYNIIVDTFSLRDIRLPDSVDAAIQAKKAAEQDLITADYKRQTVIVQAEGNKSAMIINAQGQQQAMIIKANGSAEAIRIITEQFKAMNPNATENLTNTYLTYLYIQALSDPNSNIQYIIMDSGNGVPIIIDTGKTSP